MKRLLIILFLLSAIVPVLAADRMVVFNLKTFIYHKPDCPAAQRCTKNCIMLPIHEVVKKSGRPCEKCGG